MKHESFISIARTAARLFRGLANALRREVCCPKLHFAGWR